MLKPRNLDSRKAISLQSVSPVLVRQKKIARQLAEQNIICNYNQLPGDPDPRYPSGLRLGVQEMTRMGMKESEMGEIAQLMGAVMKGKDVLQQVGRLREQFTEVQFC